MEDVQHVVNVQKSWTRLVASCHFQNCLPTLLTRSMVSCYSLFRFSRAFARDVEQAAVVEPDAGRTKAGRQLAATRTTQNDSMRPKAAQCAGEGNRDLDEGALSPETMSGRIADAAGESEESADLVGWRRPSALVHADHALAFVCGPANHRWRTHRRRMSG